MAPKNWQVGIANETWKVVICGRDLHRLNDLLSSLSYYLTDAGSDTERGLSMIRQMSGDQIVNALEFQQRTCLLTVQKALQSTEKGDAK